MKPFVFLTLRYAESFVFNARIPLCILLGENDKFWVVTLSEGSRLNKQGYDYL